MPGAGSSLTRALACILGLLVLVAALPFVPQAAAAERSCTITNGVVRFSGIEWTITNSTGSAEGKQFLPRNVWCDSGGSLHLSIAKSGKKWTGAEVVTTKEYGFGKYQVQIIGRLDRLDRNVVLGISPQKGPEGSRELGVEFSRSNNTTTPGSYVLWPDSSGQPDSTACQAGNVKRDAKGYRCAARFGVPIGSSYSTHRIDWKRGEVKFQSLAGHREDNKNQFAAWNYTAARSETGKYVPQQPMPLKLDLWVLGGVTGAPADGRPVDIVIKAVKVPIGYAPR